MAIEPDVGNIPLDKSLGDLDVKIVHKPGGKVDATVSDPRRQRAWSGEGANESAATTEAVRNFVRDRRAKEYLGK